MLLRPFFGDFEMSNRNPYCFGLSVSYCFIEGFWSLPNSQNVFELKIRNSLSKIVFDQVSAFSEVRRSFSTCSKNFLADLKIDFRVEKKIILKFGQNSGNNIFFRNIIYVNRSYSRCTLALNRLNFAYKTYYVYSNS